jgi:hypothetical protein
MISRERHPNERRQSSACPSSLGHAPTGGVVNAHYAFELKTPGFDKGKAIGTFLSCPLFSGRTPIFVGDDETDEAGFAVGSTRGGFAFSVGRPRRRAWCLRAPERSASMACRFRRIRRRRMIPERQTRTQTLDVALIGNSCAATFVDRSKRGAKSLNRSCRCVGRTVSTSPYCAHSPIVHERNTRICGGASPASIPIRSFRAPWPGVKKGVLRRHARRTRFEWAFRLPQIIRIEPPAGLPRITAFGLLCEDIHPNTGEL